MHFIQFIQTAIINHRNKDMDIISSEGKNGYYEDFSGFRSRSILVSLFFLGLVGLYVGLEFLDFEEKQASFPISEVEVVLLNSGKVLALPNEGTITDNVSVKGLEEGKIYKLEGKLIESKSGETIYYKNKPITSEKYFRYKGSNETIDLEYTVDREELPENISTVTELREER